MLLTTVAARLYIKDYWAPYKDSKGGFDGTKVPLPYMEQYNEVGHLTPISQSFQPRVATKALSRSDLCTLQRQFHSVWSLQFFTFDEC